MSIYIEAWSQLPWPIILPGVVLILAAVILWPRIFKKHVQTQPISGVIETTVTQNVDGSITAEPRKPEGRYPAYVWRDNAGITFEKIPEALGRVYMAEATLPHPGACYFVVEEHGRLRAYDPREMPLPEKGNSPRDLFRLLHWPEIAAVYTSIATMWDKINMLLPWTAVVVLGIVLIVGMDKLAR